MGSTQVKLTDRPGQKSQIAKAVLRSDPDNDALESYFKYYTEELGLLRKSISAESWQTACLAVQKYEDIFLIIDILRDHPGLRRPEIRQYLSSKLPSSDASSVDRAINLAIRLWLMINVQEPEFEGLRYEATSIQWNNEQTLEVFIQSLFPHARWHATAQSSRIGPHFTVAFMQRVCGLRIEWTTSLHDHLRLDLQRKSLKVFPYKCYLQALIDSYERDGNTSRYALEPLHD